MGPQPLQQTEAVSVGQVHVEEQQVDAAVLVPRNRAASPADRAHAGELEAGYAADVRRVGLRSELLVLDDEDPDGHVVATRVGCSLTTNCAPPSGERPTVTPPWWRRAT